ncbi:tyrosine-protein phosphatase [Streptomyces sp. NPDC088785]|uniref:tyrosine-protein phosphatase n=1 Tax=Streptomyces sp. NPDC088785 TaxID=3365897 RepID=UPI0037F3955A
MQPRRLTAAALATLVLTGTATLAHPALAQPHTAPASAGAQRAVAQAVPFTQAAAHLAGDGSYTLSWASTAATVRVTAHTRPDASDPGTPVGSAAGTGSLTVPAGALAADRRWYFELTPDTGGAYVVAERSLGIASAKNFRDAGGYRTSDGRWVKYGIVYRSNKLSGLTAAEQQRVVDQGITRDIDLRNYFERRDEPDKVPAGVAYQVADVVSLAHGVGFHDPALMTLAQALAAGLFSGSSDLGQSIGYPFMVNFVGADHAFKDLLTAIDGTAGATVFHCSAGKDRTGWGTAVLLTLLGVPRATVEADFLASNAYTGDPDAVELSWLRAAFAEADHIYGSFDAYLHQGLGLDDATVQRLRNRLLTP